MFDLRRLFRGGAGVTVQMHAATVAILAALAVLPASAVGNERLSCSQQAAAIRESGCGAVGRQAFTTTRSQASPSRRVYCFGDAAHSTNGWYSNGTSHGWFRQGYAGTLAERVVYDDSVDVMHSLGCHTVRADIRPNDPDANGGRSNQRAQLYATDATLAHHGGQPSLEAKAGKTSWYGFAFATNPGYVPHYDRVQGNWNAIFSWHDAPINGVWAPLANILLEVATIGPKKGREYRCAVGLRKLVKARLGIQLNGGDLNDRNWPRETSRATCRRYLGPVFTPGRRYRVQMRVKWGAYMDGALEVWIDGTKYVDVKRVSNVWYRGSKVDSGIYPVFENYSFYDPSLPTRSVYYGGLIKGASRSDVDVPIAGTESAKKSTRGSR